MRAVVHFAPLQGYTDAVYRDVHARVFGGVESYYTPFVRLEKGGFRNKELRDIAPEANRMAPVVPQLIASSAEEFRRIASLFGEKGYRRADLNMGCPFPPQARLRRGAGILPLREEAESLLRTVEEFPDISFSVKMRLGWESPDESFALLPLLNRLPLAHVALHPRLGIQQYKGMVDMDAFARFYEACERPLFYNGDLVSLPEMEAITARFSRLRGVMLGRGLLARPWMAEEFAKGEIFTPEDKRERLRTFHAELTKGYQARLEGGDHQVLDKLKTLWDYLLPDVGKKLRKRVAKSTTVAAYLLAVRDLLEEV